MATHREANRCRPDQGKTVRRTAHGPTQVEAEPTAVAR
jgi:hypothetical protein